MGFQKSERGAKGDESRATRWRSVAEIPGFPYGSFAELKAAVAARKASLGVDSLAAAEWAESSVSGLKRVAVNAFSLLLIVSAIAAVVAAFWMRNYWLFAAPVVQAAAFFFSHPSSPAREWATLAGVASVIVFIDFLFRGWVTASLLVAYAGLTFAAVRAAGFITGSAFRRALASDEDLFLDAYSNRACTVRDNETKRIYRHRSSPDID
jgi:hypothetical protein